MQTGIRTSVPFHVERNYAVGSMRVIPCVTVVIVHLVFKLYSPIWHVLVARHQSLLHCHVVHRCPHVSFHVQFLSLVATQPPIAVIMENALLVRCLLQENVLADM